MKTRKKVLFVVLLLVTASLGLGAKTQVNAKYNNKTIKRIEVPTINTNSTKVKGTIKFKKNKKKQKYKVRLWITTKSNLNKKEIQKKSKKYIKKEYVKTIVKKKNQKAKKFSFKIPKQKNGKRYIFITVSRGKKCEYISSRIIEYIKLPPSPSKDAAIDLEKFRKEYDKMMAYSIKGLHGMSKEERKQIKRISWYNSKDGYHYSIGPLIANDEIGYKPIVPVVNVCIGYIDFYAKTSYPTNSLGTMNYCRPRIVAQNGITLYVNMCSEILSDETAMSWQSKEMEFPTPEQHQIKIESGQAFEFTSNWFGKDAEWGRRISNFTAYVSGYKDGKLVLLDNHWLSGSISDIKNEKIYLYN